ncbi:uncharacterized protein LOC142362835 isoform X2 [Opisthocomus hoazin]|uniref:uncharacterized protein LOC142362835 isoform X2 n=1 Tax=Opisthocomus hoazin TaxID=30419 RepID=UPI003F53AEC4
MASNRKHLAEAWQQLHMQAQDMAALQAELAQAQQEQAKQQEKTAAYEEQRQQIYWELRKLRGSQEQSEQRVQALQDRLQELSSRAQHWQQLQQDRERALAVPEEELVGCKGNHLTVPALHESARLPPPSTRLQDKQQRKT